MSAGRGAVTNTAKNVALVALVVLLAIQCVAIWLNGLNIAQLSADSMLRRVHDQLFGGAVGYELRASGVAAAEPAQIALRAEGEMRAVQYNPSEVDAGIQAVTDLFGSAFSAAGTFYESDEDALNAALAEGDCAVLRYHGAIPVGILAGWMGGSCSSDLSAQSVLLFRDTNQIFVRTDTGALQVASTRVEDGVFSRAVRQFHGVACTFSGTEYTVYPETLLFEREALSFDLIQSVPLHLFDPQGDSSLQTLLSAFGYTPYARSYPEQNGAVTVYVNDASTLRVAEDGTVEYSASVGGTLTAYDKGEADGVEARGAQIDCARVVLDAALRAVGVETQATLYSVGEQDGMTRLVFYQSYGGVPVLDETDFASFVFDGGTLLSARVALRRFETVTPAQRRTVLPARQAAAGADGTRRALLVAYRQGDDGLYRPERFFMK